MKVVAIADSDSYLKWAASTLAALPAEWERDLLLVDTPVAPSAAQTHAALAVSGIDVASVERVPVASISERLAALRADVVLVATRGPVARVLIRLVGELPVRPVIVSGLPGISIPATRKALMFRVQADLFVLHSRREIRDFAAMSAANGWDHRFALATLPFIEQREAAGGTDLVFAAQAVVPSSRVDRLRVARLLVDAARADPARRVVVKVRAIRGERQTHDESDGYPDLLDELAVQSGLPANLVISSEPMSAALDRAAGLVTVSSTALIEAIARQIPVIALDTFGVSDELINPVFEGSGLFGGEASVIGREFRLPRIDWLDDNYFHPESADDCATRLAELVELRRRGELPERAAVIKRGGRLRLAWERQRAFGGADRTVAGLAAVVVGVPARVAVITGRRLTRRWRERAAAASAAKAA
ncbi:hypothetical protein BH11ACT3_BH11ACT3_01720 [soil metagenome]